MVTPLRCAVAVFVLAALSAPASAGAPTTPQPWTMQDLDRVAEAAIAAAQLAQYSVLRADRLLKLGDALAEAGDLPAAHSAFMAAAAVPGDRSLDRFRLQAVEKLVRWGYVEDAERLANSASDQQLKEKLSAAIERARNGISNPIAEPTRRNPPEQNDDDLAIATDLLKEGKLAEARAAALRASQAAPVDDVVQLGRVFKVLSEVGEYDQAIATLQPIDDFNRRQYYVYAVEAAVRAHDAAAIGRLVPIAVAGVEAPTPNLNSVDWLYRMIKALALAGYYDAARGAFVELTRVHDDLIASGRSPPNLDTIAECEALTGDLPGALATAAKAGPLVGPPNISNLQAALITTMTFANAKTPPSNAELAARLAQIKALQPALVAGPKAGALARIAADLAKMGDLDKAIEIEAALEVEPRDVLSGLRDMALAPISQAQQDAGETREALATALRISQGEARFDRLLNLAATPPRP